MILSDDQHHFIQKVIERDGFDHEEIELLRSKSISLSSLEILRLCIKEGMDITVVNHLVEHEYSNKQLEQIYQGFRDGVQFKAYMNKGLTAYRMMDLRIDLINRIDISSYNNPSLTDEEFNSLRDLQYELNMSKKNTLSRVTKNVPRYNYARLRRIVITFIIIINAFTFSSVYSTYLLPIVKLIKFPPTITMYVIFFTFQGFLIDQARKR